MKRQVELSDLQKIEQALHEAYMYFVHRDEMNARVHCGKIINSPITTKCGHAWERLSKMISGEMIAVLSEQSQESEGYK